MAPTSKTDELIGGLQDLEPNTQQPALGGLGGERRHASLLLVLAPLRSKPTRDTFNRRRVSERATQHFFFSLSLSPTRRKEFRFTYTIGKHMFYLLNVF